MGMFTKYVKLPEGLTEAAFPAPVAVGDAAPWLPGAAFFEAKWLQ